MCSCVGGGGIVGDDPPIGEFGERGFASYRYEGGGKTITTESAEEYGEEAIRARNRNFVRYAGYGLQLTDYGKREDK